ncbi:MAG TPA: formate dehydrogenase accessory protein FdhE [Dongiaceae bacterium]|nr:formate dehydrogenase accessory protein FdhE [Dongiaceae bacterium]
MSFLAQGKINYNSRILRAESLASSYAFAKEILQFYMRIAAFQKQFSEELPKIWGRHAVAPADGNLRGPLNAPILMRPFGQFLGVIEKYGPGPLAKHAHECLQKSEAVWAELLDKFWQSGMQQPPEADANGADPLNEFVARAFLQPYAEFIVAAMLPPVLAMTVCRCPRCNSLPLLGILRPEGDGGKRFLVCSFCTQEWEFRRIFCAYCGEEAEQKLPVYVAEQFRHIRVECCDSCKHFLRTIDLTTDGNAVPLVDDLAAIPLSLWADENGYKRIQANLFGT